MSLLLLYDFLIVSIFEDWIDDTDLCFLDSAVCSHSLRTHFLSTMSRCKILNTSFDNSDLNEHYDWIALRNMGLRKLLLTEACLFCLPKALQSILTKTKRIDHVQLPLGCVFAEIVQTYGISVLSCEFLQSTNEDDVAVILKTMQDLKSLDIYECYRLSDQICDTISTYCPNLKKLIAPNQIDVSVVLEKCESITSLECTTTKLSVDLPNSLVEFFLDCTDAYLLKVVNQCPRLTKCTIYEATDESLVVLIKNCPQLTFFHVDNRQVTDKTLVTLASHSKLLKHVVVRDALITDAGFSTLVKNCFNLTSIDVANCVELTDECLQNIEQYCPKLEALRVYSCTEITENGLLDLFQKCTHLTSLGCSDIKLTMQFLVNVAANMECLCLKWDSSESSVVVNNKRHLKQFTGYVMPNLTYPSALFQVNPCLVNLEVFDYVITEELVSSFVKYCPLLNRIALDTCRKLDANVMLEIAQCKHLTSLILCDMEQIRTEHMLALVHDKPDMKEISLLQCFDLSDDVIDPIAEYCPSLRSLYLTGADFLTSKSVAKIVKSCQLLNNLDVSDCSRIDSGLLRSLNGRKMRHLNIERSGISKECTVLFTSANGHNINCFYI